MPASVVLLRYLTKHYKLKISEHVKISSTKLDCYFSFLRGAKSANSELFKDFCNEAKMEKNDSNCGSYFDMLT